MYVQGIVKWFNAEKGYGFIESADGDMFVHYSAIRMDGFRALEDGQRVEFEINLNPKYPKATPQGAEVRPIPGY